MPDETLTQAIHDAAMLAADRIRPRILQLEKLGRDRASEIHFLKKELSELGRERDLLQERVAEFIARPPEHQHDPDEPNPVITLDWDGTIKPALSYADGGDYPILVNAFPKVKYWLDRWASRRACIHVATAGLYYGGMNDFEVFSARLSMLTAKKDEWGLPISIFLPKVPSDLYYDDRMVVIPPGKNPDWDIVGAQVESDLGKRFDLVDGEWIRKEKKRVGTEIEVWPDIKQFPVDHPRGYSGPRIDVDMHRTLSLSSSSLRVAPPREGARDGLLYLYNRGITIRISCAGWNPKTHPYIDAMKRLAGIRQWLLENSIPYDRIVTKDHADAYIDDKGFRFTDWRADLPAIMKRLPVWESYHHGD